MKCIGFKRSSKGMSIGFKCSSEGMSIGFKCSRMIKRKRVMVVHFRYSSIDSTVLDPSPLGVLRVEILRILVGILTGPATLSFLSFDL